MIKTIHFYGKIVALVLALAVLGFLFPAQYTHAEVNYGANTPSGQTGVYTANTTALDYNMATLISGENQVLNRMMFTPAYTCFATTTDTLVKTGYGILGSSFIASHSSDVTLSFYDGTTTGALSSIIVQDFVLSAGTASQKTWGGEFATGLYLDITGTGTSTICYR